MYWNMAQQLAHAIRERNRDASGRSLCVEGTISGSTPHSLGSFIELTWNGTKPIALPNGEKRTFLENGDEVTLRGWCEAGGFHIGFGSASGRIQA